MQPLVALLALGAKVQWLPYAGSGPGPSLGSGAGRAPPSNAGDLEPIRSPLCNSRAWHAAGAPRHTRRAARGARVERARADDDDATSASPFDDDQIDLRRDLLRLVASRVGTHSIRTSSSSRGDAAARTTPRG